MQRCNRSRVINMLSSADVEVEIFAKIGGRGTFLTRLYFSMASDTNYTTGPEPCQPTGRASSHQYEPWEVSVQELYQAQGQV